MLLFLLNNVLFVTLKSEIAKALTVQCIVNDKNNFHLFSAFCQKLVSGRFGYCDFFNC